MILGNALENNVLNLFLNIVVDESCIIIACGLWCI